MSVSEKEIFNEEDKREVQREECCLTQQCAPACTGGTGRFFLCEPLRLIPDRIQSQDAKTVVLLTFLFGLCGLVLKWVLNSCERENLHVARLRRPEETPFAKNTCERMRSSILEFNA